MIPASIINKFNQKEEAINFGSVLLEVVKHDGRIVRYLWTDETSEVQDSPTSGEGLHEKQGKFAKNKENIAVLPVTLNKGMRNER